MAFLFMRCSLFSENVYIWICFVKCNVMRRLLIVFFLTCGLFECVWSASRTMRIDLTLRGELDSCCMDLVSCVYWEGWFGPQSCCDSDIVKGQFIYSLYSLKGGEERLRYKDGFSSLYYEWATMDYEGRDKEMVFEHTLLVPYTESDVRLVVECRVRDGLKVVMDKHIDVSEVERQELVESEVKLLQGEEKSDSKALDVAILAEGFTLTEELDFWSRADSLAMALMSEPAFVSFADDICIRGFFKPSKTKGPSDPSMGYKSESVLNSSFGVFASDRYLETFKTFSVFDYVGNKPADMIIVLVNSKKYGGGGVYNCFAIGSLHDGDWIEVLLHEVGHSFAGLADEYYYENEVYPDMYPKELEPWEPNVTTLVSFEKKWKEMYENGATGLIEGAAYNAKGVYRSSVNCKMRQLHKPFCKVCNEAIGQQIRRYIE